jgi:hypothetical protein
LRRTNANHAALTRIIQFGETSMPHTTGGTVIQGSFPNGVPRWLSGPGTRLQSLPRATGAGEPLPVQVRQAMESMFGVSFAAVRVHVGPHPATIGAVAFTQGTNVHFAPGHYDPSTVRGRSVLAHELTHVVQQRAGRVRNPNGSGVAVVSDRALEAEAERMALRASALRIEPEAVAPVQRKTPHRGTIQMWPRPLTLIEAKQYLDEKIDGYCRAQASAFPATILKDDESAEYKALVRQLRGDPAAPDGWFNDKAAKIYAQTLIPEFARAPRRLSVSQARAVIDEEIRGHVRRAVLHPSLAESLRDYDAKDYKAMVARVRGTDGAPERWATFKALQIYAKNLSGEYVSANSAPSPAAWPRALTADEATVVIHTAVAAELKHRTELKEGYAKTEEERIKGKRGEALKEFKEIVTAIRGAAGNEPWRNTADARRYVEVSGLIAAFVTKILRIPSVPLSRATTLDSTSYSMRHLFCDAVRIKHNTVDDDHLRNALNRMDSHSSVHNNSGLTKLAVGSASKGDIGKLQGGMHASFGRGPGGCTFFFRSPSSSTHEILAIGYHVLNSENYEIVWAFNAALRGRWEF